MRSRSLEILSAIAIDPQIDRHRLAGGEQADGQLVDLLLELVDLVVVARPPARPRSESRWTSASMAAASWRSTRPPMVTILRGELGQILVERADGVLAGVDVGVSHAIAPQPNRPVM